VVIHCRDAFDDCIALLEERGFSDRRVVFHCFTGSARQAELVSRRGWRISFTGIVTFKKARELQVIARDYPADRLMLETDAPYLSPEPVRSVRPNEPAHVVHIGRFLADLRGESAAELAHGTTENARRFFDLPA
jgi:TatD DNase family protein